MMLPRHFCWTKFGVEAGEDVQSILQRKEQERRRADGVFIWGVGNALGPSISHLLTVERSPELIFSPIISKPKAIDVKPSCVARWTSGVGVDGKEYPLPQSAAVTSRWSDKKSCHYAFVCYSPTPLQLDEVTSQTFSSSSLSNMLTGKPVGYSQVSSVVTYNSDVTANGTLYIQAMRVKLVYPYFIKLIGAADLNAAQSSLALAA